MYANTMSSPFNIFLTLIILSVLILPCETLLLKAEELGEAEKL